MPRDSEYESGLSTIQSYIVGLKRQIEDVEVHARQLEQSYPLVRQLEDELGSYRRVFLSTHFFFFYDAELDLV
jgi:hypothetical protein